MTVSVDGKRFFEDLFAQGKIGWVRGEVSSVRSIARLTLKRARG